MSSGRSFRLLLLMSNHFKLDIRSTQIGIEWNLFADTSTNVSCFRLLSQKEAVLYFSYFSQIQEDISFINHFYSSESTQKDRSSLCFYSTVLPALSLSHHFIEKGIQKHLPAKLFNTFLTASGDRMKFLFFKTLQVQMTSLEPENYLVLR